MLASRKQEAHTTTLIQYRWITMAIRSREREKDGKRWKDIEMNYFCFWYLVFPLSPQSLEL